MRIRGLLLVLTCVASACGASRAPIDASAPLQKDVAQRFAEAIVGGRADAAIRLLVRPDDTALSRLARGAAGKKLEHVHVLSRKADGRRWSFRFAGRRTHTDGRFEDVHGDLTVIVGTSSGRTGVEFFAVRHDTVRFSTHHDSQLLPSNR